MQVSGVRFGPVNDSLDYWSGLPFLRVEIPPGPLPSKPSAQLGTDC